MKFKLSKWEVILGNVFDGLDEEDYFNHSECIYHQVFMQYIRKDEYHNKKKEMRDFNETKKTWEYFVKLWNDNDGFESTFRNIFGTIIMFPILIFISTQVDTVVFVYKIFRKRFIYCKACVDNMK